MAFGILGEEGHHGCGGRLPQPAMGHLFAHQRHRIVEVRVQALHGTDREDHLVGGDEEGVDDRGAQLELEGALADVLPDLVFGLDDHSGKPASAAILLGVGGAAALFSRIRQPAAAMNIP